MSEDDERGQDDDRRQRAKVIDAAAGHLMTGGVAAIATTLATPLGPLAPIVGLGAGALVKAFFAWASEEGALRAQTFGESLEEELRGVAPQEELAALLEGPLRGATFHGFRAAMDALDPEVVPVLARPVSWYRADPLDAFFRGASRVLRDLTAGDLGEFRVMLAFAATAGSGPAIRVEHHGATHSCIAHTYLVNEGATHVADVRQLAPERAPRGAWVRLFDLLERHGVARRDQALPVDEVVRVAADPHASIALVIRRDMVERLGALVDPPAAPLTEEP